MPHPRSGLRDPDIRDVPVHIYAFVDPNGTIRYVGKSRKPSGRLSYMYSQAGSGAVRFWLAELAAIGQAPTIRILFTVPPGEDAAPHERRLIREHDTGALLNFMGTRAEHNLEERRHRGALWQMLRTAEIVRPGKRARRTEPTAATGTDDQKAAS
jgi:hypothetical protein